MLEMCCIRDVAAGCIRTDFDSVTALSVTIFDRFHHTYVTLLSEMCLLLCSICPFPFSADCRL